MRQPMLQSIHQRPILNQLRTGSGAEVRSRPHLAVQVQRHKYQRVEPSRLVVGANCVCTCHQSAQGNWETGMKQAGTPDATPCTNVLNILKVLQGNNSGFRIGISLTRTIHVFTRLESVLLPLAFMRRRCSPLQGKFAIIPCPERNNSI